MEETNKMNSENKNKVFTHEGFEPAEEYLKKMLSCVDENGVIEIARDELPEMAFVTGSNAEDATLIERFELDPKRIGFDAVLSFYNNLIEAIKNKSLKAETKKLNKDNKLTKRLSAFARRVEALMKFDNPKCPEILLYNEQCMLIDTVTLYLGTER